MVNVNKYLYKLQTFSLSCWRAVFLFCVIPRALARGTSYTIERGNWPLSTFPKKQKSFSWSVISNEVRNLLRLCFLGGVGWRTISNPLLNRGDPSQIQLGMTLKKLSGTKHDFSSVYVSVMQNRTTWVSWFLVKFL